MTKWEYKSVRLERTGTKEDFGFNWTYTPWEVAMGGTAKQPLDPALKELGSDGWELSGVIPSDLWAEAGGRSSSYGVRAISCTLVFKRQVESSG